VRPAPSSTPSIVRILAVHDTRDWIEDGDDRWVAVPGSGQARPCDRCGRDHEIHVEVLLSDGATALIGQGCARGDSMEADVKSAVSAEKTRARLARELAAVRARRAAAQAAWARVEWLSPPAPVLVEERPGDRGRSPLQIWGMGSATVYCHSGFDAERRRCLLDAWRHDRYAEQADIPRGRGGYPELPWSFDGPIADLERRLAKILKKLPPPPAA